MKLNDLKFDDDVTTESSPIMQPTTNVTQKLWETVKANPNITSIQIAQLAMGGNPEGVTTRLIQMIKRNLMSRTEADGLYRYTVVGDAYPALNRMEVIAKAQAARAEKKAKREKQREYYAKSKAKLKAEAPDIPPTSLSSNPSAEQLVNSMSVGMAKAVYLELKRVFEQ